MFKSTEPEVDLKMKRYARLTANEDFNKSWRRARTEVQLKGAGENDFLALQLFKSFSQSDILQR